MDQESSSSVDFRVTRLRRELRDLEKELDRIGRPARRRPWRPMLVVALAVILAVIVPAGVLATHIFSDVPTNSTFHANISNIAQAGITVGCTASTYCPADPVRRDAMAAFLNRGLGRVALGSDAGVNLSATYANVGSTTLAAPGAGYALVTVSAMAYTSDTTGCPCNIVMRTEQSFESAGYYFRNTLFNPAVGVASVYLGNTWVHPIPAKGNYTFTVKVLRETGTATTASDAAIAVTWFPFNAVGGANFGGIEAPSLTGQDVNTR